MAVKNCCIKTCKSCSTRKEDNGVTYHKFPKDPVLRNTWMSITCCHNLDLPKYVCSRHFCKNDFQSYKDSKYILKSDAVPSIFPWTMSDIAETTKMATSETKVDEDIPNPSETQNELKISDSSKESEENLDAIRKFIEDQDKEIQEKNAAASVTDVVQTETNSNNLESSDNGQNTRDDNVNNCDVGSASKDEIYYTDESISKDINNDKSATNDISNNDNNEGAMTVGTVVMDMILNESEVKINEKNDLTPVSKYSLSPDKVASSSISLSVGSRIEAKDYGDEWHPAQIVEVDYDEMEVLVRYEPYNKSISRHDEWISVSSPRLRPTSDTSKREANVADKMPEQNTPLKVEVKEPKVEEKPKLTFAVGERCLARWRDNRRFMATVQNDLGNGTYEIIFDDGFYWKCNVTRLYKWKPAGKQDLLTVDTSLHSPMGAPSPIQVGGPSTAVPPNTVAFHTHLFDPTRDYLSSKSERREMKRKLNIKEIFNIGQKRPKTKSDKVVRKPRIIRRTPKVKTETNVKKELKVELKREIPDAVASIIGTVSKEEHRITEIRSEDIIEVKLEEIDKDDHEITDVKESKIVNTQVAEAFKMDPFKAELDPVHQEDVKLEKFDKLDDGKHEEVIDRIKEVINKLEGGLNEGKVNSPKLETKEEIPTANEIEPVVAKEEPDENVVDVEAIATAAQKIKMKKLSKIKKGKKLRMLQEKKVKKQVQKVKNELEEMKRQVEEMRKQMLLKTQEFAKGQTEMPESFLLPGEWCCRWLNGQPIGTVSEIVCESKVDGDGKPGLPRRSVQVEDKRLPLGWTKHMVRRSLGHSAGKWDVVLVSPENRRFHTKTDMRNYLENNTDESLKQYEAALMDFGVHLKLARRMGWITTTPGGVADGPLPCGTLHSTSPLVKRKKLNLKKMEKKNREKKSREKKNRDKKKKISFRIKMASASQNVVDEAVNRDTTSDSVATPEPNLETMTLEDGYVYVGSLKVQVIDTLLRCPADGCFKNFRNNTLLQMHIKHYHRDLREKLGDTPKVLDLAYARTMPLEPEPTRQVDSKIIKVKLPKPRREEPKHEPIDVKPDLLIDAGPKTPVSPDCDTIPKTQDSPKLRDALINKPVKRPKVLLPVRRPEFDPESTNVNDYEELPEIPIDDCVIAPLDFETAISTHTVTKPIWDKGRKGEKKRKSITMMSQKTSEDEEWYTNSDFETRSSFPRSGSPDSKSAEMQLVKTRALTPESYEEHKESQYTYTENGERVKIVHMKREEIINCHCGYREEDGLMVQCELCLCWQHALCHNIQSEAQVPEKYTCSICLNPRRGRRSQRFLHDQDRLYEGLLPGAKPCDLLRRSHELSGNLLRIQDALHALRVKCFVASKKDHPKLYLWAKDWEHAEISYTQEKLNSDYSDLNIMINTVGKENMPIKPEDMKDIQLGLSSDDGDHDRFSQRDSQLSSNALLNNLLASPGGASLDLPISTSELETLAKSVQEQEECCVSDVGGVGGVGAVDSMVMSAPQPEAAIENGACRVRLLRHLQRCHALVDARLDSIEAQVAELESQDPSFEDDETPDFFPRTKQTVQMMLRDLDTMEELGIIT